MRLLAKVFRLCTIALLVAVSAAGQDSSALPDLSLLRPCRLDLGGMVARSINRFCTPVIYDVHLDTALVQMYLPVRLQPRLDRGTPGLQGKIEKMFLKPGYLHWTSRVLRSVETDEGRLSKEQLAILLPEREPFCYVISGTRLSFTKTGLGFGIDRVSKHAVITPSLEDVRFAGQLWRTGDTLWINAHSGTFLKKRKSSRLNEAPEPEAMMAVMRQTFEPDFRLVYSEDVAPGFGKSEAIEQADKAITAAEEAEAAAAKPDYADVADDLYLAAEEARVIAKEAKDIAALMPEADEAGFYEHDRMAAKAASAARKARKDVEHLLEKEESVR